MADEETLRRLWSEHASALLGFALRLCHGDRGSAEDVVQETLLRAWRHPEALDPGRGPLRPWLFTVARRIVTDRERARAARPAEVVGECDDDFSRADDIDQVLEAAVVADALASLTVSHREALLHTFYAGHTVSEAAAVLQIPVGTVKSRIFYALRALRLALEERGVAP